MNLRQKETAYILRLNLNACNSVLVSSLLEKERVRIAAEAKILMEFKQRSSGRERDITLPKAISMLSFTELQ